MCERNGITHYEFSHLFTQWGAAHAPKIMALVDGKPQRIFGWETDAAGEAYGTFLDQFLPELITFIKKHQLEKNVFFHVSDEPVLAHQESYSIASQILKKHLHEFTFIDALSDFEFYKNKLVELPIPANNHIEPFIEGQVEPLWTYYCCVQSMKVSNRYFSMPSYRNRILGTQLYKYDVKGFLHWGYNFWYSRLSVREIDPFRVTDADCGFPSGDAFVVYPGSDGPLDSLRWEVFYEGLQDMRAMTLLEQLTSRENVLALIEQDLQEPITFSSYPRSIHAMLLIRERINAAIADALS